MNQTLDQPEQAGLTRSICTLNSFNKSSGYTGQGVFLLPDIVLTAWHVVQGARSLTAITPDGRTAEIVRGSPFSKKSETLDLAIVEISRPLSSSVALFSQTERQAMSMKGRLISAFSGFPLSYKAGIDPKALIKEEQEGISLRSYLSEAHVRKGYSGSPVFDSTGKLVSIVTKMTHNPVHGNNLESPPNEEYPQGLYGFVGPKALATASFIRQALQL